ncbi:hypothetical protein E4T56_gene549 [Termitomyces sp. T112]|nr:hypothetical protein E4T56_gene549 [Termitomyces sp. T112]
MPTHPVLALAPAAPTACPLPLKIAMDVDMAQQLRLEVCYPSTIEQEELLLQLLAAKDTARVPSLNKPSLELTPEEANIRASQTTSQQLAQAFATNTMPQEFQDVVPPYLHAFEDVFSKAFFDLLPECKRWDHAIGLLPNSAPSSCKVYPLVPREQDKLDAFLQENLDSGHIYPSKFLMASLVFFIKKKDGSLQLVQDYWGAQYFIKLNVQWGYNNVHIQEGDKWKAAFQTNWGLFEPLVMFFDLTNSPATFQTMMNNIFQDLIAEGIVCVYLDNILIYTNMLEEHHWITRLILKHLCWHQLYLMPEKCEFKQTWIKYLGLIISHGTAEMDPVKVAGVAEWLEPQNKKEDFLHHTCPLFDLTEKDVMWSWGPLEQMAFDTLKHAVTSRPILLFLDNNFPFCMEANSSDFAIGAVLSQQFLEDGK